MVNYPDMESDTGNPFIEGYPIPFVVISTYSGSYPRSLLYRPFIQRDDLADCQKGSVTVVSGGWRRVDDGGEGFPTGVVGTAPLGLSFVEALVARLVDPDDRVVVIRDLVYDKPAIKPGAGEESNVRLYRSNNLEIVQTTGDVVSSLRWCEGTKPADRLHLFAFRGSQNAFESAMNDCVASGGDPGQVLNSFHRGLRHDSATTLCDLGDYNFWLMLSGFDAEDVYIFKRTMGGDAIRESARDAARASGVRLYDGGTPYDLQECGFFIEDNHPHSIPDSWILWDDLSWE